MTSFVTVSVDLNQSLLTYLHSAQPCTLNPASHKACGSLWVKEAYSGTQPPIDIHNLPLQNDSPGTTGNSLSFFLLKNHESGEYMAPLYVHATATQGTLDDATTMFIVQANGSKDDALICAMIQLQSDQGTQANTLLVWLNEHDTQPKALCMGSGSAMRVYARPQPCANDSSILACSLTWQACNTMTGYCFDAAFLNGKTNTSPSGAIQQSNLAFPNCVSRRLAGVFPAAYSVCNNANELTHHVSAHKSPAVLSNAPYYHDELEFWSFTMVIGIACMVLVAIAIGIVIWRKVRRRHARMWKRHANRKRQKNNTK